MKMAAKKPKTKIGIFFGLILPLSKMAAARKPIIPKVNICHGVHGPCPKKQLETKAEIAPVKKPALLPRQIPEIITMASMGLNCGSIKNAALPATEMAHKTLIKTSSLESGFLSSKLNINGIKVSNIIKILFSVPE